MTNSRERDFIDLCKGVAILMVILVHSAQPFKLPSPWAEVLAMGQMGCQMFFVLSGYTLCRSLDTKQLTFTHFMKRRVTRIIPSWWGIICCYLLIGNISIRVLGCNFTGSNLNIWDVIINLLLLNGVVYGEVNNRVVRGGWVCRHRRDIVPTDANDFQALFQTRKQTQETVAAAPAHG
jgi:peptidoglycan/LPS O-acetylase OafA/YrhL